MARRWIFYLAINILVSAATMVTVLVIWERSQTPQAINPPTLTPSTQGVIPPTFTFTFFPTATPHIYVVKPGDTPGGIAEMFDVDLDELLAINNITDPTALAVGQELIIPPSVNPTPGGSADFPTVTPREGETVPWPVIDSVTAPGDPEREAVYISNKGPTIDMTGWKILAPSGQSYIFDAFELVTGGVVRVHTGKGQDLPSDRYWGLADPLWRSGDEVLLYDAHANLRSVFLIP